MLLYSVRGEGKRFGGPPREAALNPKPQKHLSALYALNPRPVRVHRSSLEFCSPEEEPACPSEKDGPREPGLSVYLTGPATLLLPVQSSLTLKPQFQILNPTNPKV